jgi:steroid 5-alpha reductase family enzyme
MSFIMVYLIGGLVILSLMFLLWLASLALKNASIVDMFWGTGFVIAAWAYAQMTPFADPVRRYFLLALVTVWGLRLSYYILRRNWGKPEDFRYAKWRAETGAPWWWQSLFRVFLLQGVLMWIISIPLLAAQLRPGLPFGAIDLLAVIVWGIGFLFEALGDWQLARFKAIPHNRGQVMTQGVWRYTRHPNYFGDAAQWWGYYLFALAAGGWWAILGPILMTLFLVRVSGVALLEKTMSTRPGYAEYAARTSAFLPLPPRRKG